MRRTVSTAFIGLALVFMPAAPAAAQGVTIRGLLGAGLSFLHISDCSGECTGTGFVVDFAQTITALNKVAIGGVGDFGFNHFDGANTFSVSGGVRFTGTANARVQPFGQVLLGLFHLSVSDCTGTGTECSSNDFTLAPGGGVDIRLTDKVNVRAQVDFFIVMAEGETENAQRFWFGISIPLGR
jgi:opacity protein-like surface antigen